MSAHACILFYHLAYGNTSVWRRGVALDRLTLRCEVLPLMVNLQPLLPLRLQFIIRRFLNFAFPANLEESGRL